MLNGMITLVTLVGIYASSRADTFQYDKYGGWTGLSSKATGFFYTEKINGIWWLIDPDGNAFISKGVNHISFTGDNSPALGYSPYGRATEEKYGNIQNWAETSIKRLKGWNFNTVGAWSSSETFDKGMPYTIIMGIGAAARASWLEGTFTDVFSPEFQDIAENRAKRICEPVADDPLLIGYFLDNELRWGPDWRSNKTLFDDFLAMPENAHGKKALINMLKEMYGDIEKLNSLWNTSLHSFDDLLKVKNLSELGHGIISAQQELETRLKQRVTIPKEAALLYLNQFYGSLDKVNEAFNTKAHSYEELLTPQFLSLLTLNIDLQELPREMLRMGIEMVYGPLDKANEAFKTKAASYDELVDELLKIKPLSPIAMEIKKVRSRFLEIIAAQYFRVCRDAIRKFDKNHLILGCRFAGYAPTEVLQGMNEYVDVVSYNNYNEIPPEDRLREIYEITGKPVMLTEFSFKAMDSGLPNTKGAGRPVQTQQDRADGFDRYVTALINMPFMVGYHWFEHADEPSEGRFDGKNSNYGVVNIKDEPWEVLTSRMTEVNMKMEKIHSLSRKKLPEVPPGHPRVYIRPSDIPEIKKKIESQEFSKAWETIKKSDNILCKAFYYMISGEQKAGRQAIEGWFDYFQKYYNDPDHCGRVFFNIIHIGACVYDWCYDLLTSEEKSRFIELLKKAAASHGPGYPANPDGHAVVGHDTEGWLLTGQLPAGLAIYDESKDMYDAAASLFFNRFVPVRNFLYKSHMHHQGDSYFTTRFMHDQTVSWLFRRIGAGDVFTQEQQFVPYQLIYNLRPDGQQMRSGDTFNHAGDETRKRFVFMMTGSYYDDPYLMTMADSEFFGRYADYDYVFELLFRKPNAEKRPISELPLAKYFPSPMGEMIARTGWNMGVESKDAVVHARIGEYFFGNHQCKDFGIFQIYYRGPLAISTGVYDEYGNAQWKNYLHQTISKNGLLIFDPLENMGKGSANDGGQRWPVGSDHPKNLDVLLTRDYKMGTVTAHEFGPDSKNPEYSYISGDITNAYSSQKVNRVTRSMVTFNTKNEKYPCIFVVMDRVDSNNPDFKKTWLLHSIQEPKIYQNTATIVRDEDSYKGGKYGGKLIVNTLLPEEISIVKIGGPGKEFWLESTNTNYYAEARGKAAEPGAWRIEISPKVKSESDVFLNVLTVMDKTTSDNPAVQKLDNGDLVGAKILDLAVLFDRNGETSKKAEFSIDGSDMTRILICDLKPGTWSIKRNGEEIGRFQASEDGKCIYLKVLPGSYFMYKL